MSVHSMFEAGLRYPLQALKDKISLLTPDALDRINQCVVKHGHRLLGKSEYDLKARCDSIVVETNVHHPTGINLLLDAMRKVLTLLPIARAKAGIQRWRQSKHNSRKIKKLYRQAQKLKHSTSKDPKKKKIAFQG